MRLVQPTTDLHRSYLAAVDEFAGAHRDGDGMWTWIDDNGTEHGYTREEMESETGFAHFVRRRTDPDRPIPAGWVPCTFYWMEQDGEFIGSVMIRHELNDFLRHEGGHIGYSVRPSARRRGHATEALRQSLAACRELGLERVLVTCDDDNIGSATVIEANGGVLENTVTSERHGKPVRRYWIELTSPDPRIRAAEPADVPRILQLVRDLAAYEREPDAVEATDRDFAAALFPATGAPTAYAHVAEVDGEVVGMALWFLSFSTWTGKPGIHLEDLYVDPAHRGNGLGKALLLRLAQICVDRGYPRLEWWVLRWNTPSIEFYDALGAVPMDDWIDYRVDGPTLTRLGGAR